MTGGLMIGPHEGVLVQGALASARTHRLPHELISAEEVQRRFPPFRLPPSTVAVQEPNAGVLFPEACVRAHLDGAAAAGAALHFEEAVRRWSASVDRVEVTTSRATYTAGRLVPVAGLHATSTGPCRPPTPHDRRAPAAPPRRVGSTPAARRSRARGLGCGVGGWGGRAGRARGGRRRHIRRTLRLWSRHMS